MKPSSALRVFILVATLSWRSSSSVGDAAESVKLIYGETGGISWTDLADGDRKPPLLTMPDIQINSVDYHYKRNLFFFTGYGAIWRKRWADGEIEYEIVNGEVEEAKLAVDWVNDHIYWTDLANNWVWRCDLEGNSRDLLLTDVGYITKQNNLAVDPYMMYVFLATESGYILRTGLGGDSPIKLNHSLKLSSIALDIHNRRLYVSGLQGYDSAIQSFNYDGVDVINYNLEGDNVSWLQLGSISVFSGLEGEPTQLFWVHHNWGVLDTVWRANVSRDQLSWEREYVIKANLDFAPTIWCVKVYHPEVQLRPQYWEKECRESPEEYQSDGLARPIKCNTSVSATIASTGIKTCATFTYLILSIAFSSIL